VLEDREAQAMAETLRRGRAAGGFVDLNTCNRTEWIVSGGDPTWAASLLRSQMVLRAGSDAARRFAPYVHVGEQAAIHVFRVALGQESLVVGERQIAGQLHAALQRARARGSCSRVLNGLGTTAGRLVRTARKRGQLGGSSVGVHSLALSWLDRHLEAGRRARIAVVGLGQIGRRVLELIRQENRHETVALNRTVARGDGARVCPLEDLPGVLAEVDAAIVCTGAPGALLRASHFAGRTAGRPLLVVDIGIPEQVERTGVPAGVTVIGLDELTAFYRESHPEGFACSSETVQRLIDGALAEFRAFCGKATYAEIIDTVQRSHRRLVREDIPRVLAGRLGALPEDARTRLGQELRDAILDYTSEVFRAIRSTATRREEDSWQDGS
jgi:glutamyl-tRNA reductase